MIGLRTLWTRWHTYADSRNLQIIKCQHLTLATGLCIHCIGLCFWLFSTWRVNTWTSDHQILQRRRPPLETNTSAGLIQSLILPQAVWTSVSTVPPPHHPRHPPSLSPFCPRPKGWEGEIWRFDQRAKENCWFFPVSVWQLHLLTVFVFTVNIPCAYNTSLCV